MYFIMLFIIKGSDNMVVDVSNERSN